MTTAVAPAPAIMAGAHDAAKRCGISRSTLLKLTAQKLAPPPVRVGRRCLWRVADLEQWAADGCKAWGA